MEIPHPTDPDRMLWDARSDQGPFTGAREDGRVVFDEESTTLASSSPDVGVLGSGSDFTVFLQRIGVCSMTFRLDC